MGEFETLKQQFPRVRRGVPLKKHTTFRIGGAAKYFFAARTSDELESAVRTAKELELPFFLLSGGSNVLVSDNGFPGLVIQIKNSKFKIENSAVRAEAGVQMATLVKETGKRGLQGLEWAGGLPGTLGGAVRGKKKREGGVGGVGRGGGVPGALGGGGGGGGGLFWGGKKGFFFGGGRK